MFLLLPTALTQDCQPFAVRLSLGGFFNPQVTDSALLVIAFNTEDKCSIPVSVNSHQLNCSSRLIQISPKQFNVTYTFSTYVHKCQLYNPDYLIIEKTRYSFNYQVGTRSFQGSIPDPLYSGPQKYLVIGDWGLIRNHKQYDDIIPCLKSSLQKQNYSLALFMGDLAYDLQSNNCTQYRQFLSAIEFVTSRLPFMLVPGNHQMFVRRQVSGTLFNLSFFMPRHDQTYNALYSFTLGNTHFLAFNPYNEVYKIQPANTTEQLAFMRKDLQSIHAEWIIPFSHYPFYCSFLIDPNDQTCSTNKFVLKPYAQLFYEFKVRLYLSGHVHLYQRQLPIDPEGNVSQFQKLDYEGKPLFDKTVHPIYIVQGDAGNDYFVKDSPYPTLNYTAKIGYNTGFGELLIVNDTLLNYRRIRVGNQSLPATCFVEDEFFLRKQLIKSEGGLAIWLWIGVGSVLLTGIGVLWLSLKKGSKKIPLADSAYQDL